MLPDELIRRASLRGREYAWPLDDIPKVIEAARRADLINIGGQLEFRFPEGGTCECWWVQVDTYRKAPKELSWDERVANTAVATLTEFSQLRSEYDFLAEGRKSFSAYFDECEAQGYDPRDAMCFVWYLETKEEEIKLRKQ